MGKIVCLMGKSSSGKDTIYKRLLSQDKVKLRNIVPYTTRPIRAEEREGVEYHFTDEEGYQRLLQKGVVIEARAYHTCLGLWRYFTVADERIEMENHSYVMIATLEAYKQIQKYYGAVRVLPILIELDDGIRLQRALDREKAQDQPRYEEMCRRFLADAQDFSTENIRKAGIVKRFYNNDLEECLEEILGYLRDNI